MACIDNFPNGLKHPENLSEKNFKAQSERESFEI